VLWEARIALCNDSFTHLHVMRDVTLSKHNYYIISSIVIIKAIITITHVHAMRDVTRFVLQCVAVWCSVVQCGAVWCSVLQCVAVCERTLSHIFMRCVT